jgi:predicted nucleic acid-binding protein
VDDPSEPRQLAAARALLERAKEVYVPQIVQVETVWVLAGYEAAPRRATPPLASALSRAAAGG